MNEDRRNRAISDVASVDAELALRDAFDASLPMPNRASGRSYGLEFSVPVDTPGGYVRAIFAMYGVPRRAADAFFADVSSAIRDGRYDLLISEERLIENALAKAFALHGCDDGSRRFLEAELVALLASGRRAA